MSALADTIPQNRLQMIIKELWKHISEFDGYSSVEFIHISVSWKAEYVVDKLMRKLKSNEERFNVLKNLIENSDAKLLQNIGHEFNKIELSYGRLAGQGKTKEVDQIINLNELDKLEEIYSNQANYLAENNELFNTNNLDYFVYLWNSFDHQRMSDYINKNLDDDVFLLKLISRVAGEWSGSNGQGWSYRNVYFDKIFSYEMVYSRLKAFDKRKIFSDFNEEEQIKIASFYLNYGNTDPDDDANVEKAKELIENWRTDD